MILLSVVWMFSGVIIGHGKVVLTTARWGMLKYYTVDSNILMGVVAAIAAHAQNEVLKGKRAELPSWLPALKLIGVVGVTLTMLVTVFFLGPTMPGGYRALFSNSNFFLHLVNPLMSIYTLLVPERGSCAERKETLYGVSSVVIYAACYALNCAVHTVDNHQPRPLAAEQRQEVKGLIILLPFRAFPLHGSFFRHAEADNGGMVFL